MGIYAIAIDPSAPATLYAGTWGGGVFKTTNGGTSWTAVNSGFTDPYVLALAIDPSTPATLYAGTYFGVYVFKSTDGGTNWTAVNSGPTNAVQALAIDPSTPATLYAGTWADGVFKSTNGGTNWAAVNSGLTDTYVFALAIDPSAPATLYAGGARVFKSTNGGTSWTAVNSGLTDLSVYALAIDPSSPATLYAGTGGGSVFKSTNGGTRWSGVKSAGPTSSRVQALAIDPSTPATLYVGTEYGGVFKSTNGGTTWQPTGASYGNGTPPATAISMVSGNNQTGAAGQPLRYPLVVVVTNASGVPVAGVTVNFGSTAGGGTLWGTQSTTDSQGVAYTTLTLGPTPGTNTVTATASGLTAVTFTASATALAANAYMVGDTFPFGADPHANLLREEAGEFGDNQLTILDLIYALRAVTSVPGYRPRACSDRFDAMDSFPKDTYAARGGDGILNTVDLIYTLRRVTNVDTSRPQRTSSGLACPAQAPGQQAAPLAHRPSSAFTASVEVGNAIPADGSLARVPVFLRAGGEASFAGLSMAFGMVGGVRLRFLPAEGVPAPSLVDDELPGVLALAWLEGLQMPASRAVLLGYLEIPGAQATLSPQLYGVSANTSDGGEIQVTPGRTSR
jgi:photosystem II stability/assembly factor-like uncharacterized protein